jgi:hypothetical protein
VHEHIEVATQPMYSENFAPKRSCNGLNACEVFSIFSKRCRAGTSAFGRKNT